MPTSPEAGTSVSLYVVYHQNIVLPEIPALTFLRSDQCDLDNIADKKDYCELRAQYYVWKNLKSDYVGFFQYRRYLDLDEKKLVCRPCAKRPCPYKIQRFPQPIQYIGSQVDSLLSSFDVIAPIWEYTGLSVWERYGIAKGHRHSDLKLVYDIIRRKYPEYLPAAEKYLSGKGEYFGNIFIMSWDLFDAYCKWLFAILQEFDRKADDPPTRTDGYLGERLLGIYITWLKQKQKLRCAELPRVHFYGYDDKRHHLFFAKFLNYVLPPGSVQRATMRSLSMNKDIGGHRI